MALSTLLVALTVLLPAVQAYVPADAPCECRGAGQGWAQGTAWVGWQPALGRDRWPALGRAGASGSGEGHWHARSANPPTRALCTKPLAQRWGPTTLMPPASLQLLAAHSPLLRGHGPPPHPTLPHTQPCADGMHLRSLRCAPAPSFPGPPAYTQLAPFATQWIITMAKRNSKTDTTFTPHTCNATVMGKACNQPPLQQGDDMQVKITWVKRNASAPLRTWQNGVPVEFVARLDYAPSSAVDRGWRKKNGGWPGVSASRAGG